jgi:hypothetical protein
VCPEAHAAVDDQTHPYAAADIQNGELSSLVIAELAPRDAANVVVDENLLRQRGYIRRRDVEGILDR